jgi:GDP-4-dehydro-6-deoxy-D-mannose reductase
MIKGEKFLRILITGSLGFVGKHLIKHLSLKNNCEILGLDIKLENFEAENSFKESDKLKVIEIDLRDKEKVLNVVREFKPDQIYHLAAQSSVSYSWENPIETIEINVFGGINLLDAVKKYCDECKILMICTAEEYGGIIPQNKAITEDFRISPSNPYAISKAALDFFSTTYQKAHDLKIFVSRSFNHIGSGQSERFVTSDFAKQIAEIEKGIREPAVKVGNIEVFRDFLDIRDVVEAYCRIINFGKVGEVYNVCSGVKSKIANLLDLLISYSTYPGIKIEIDKNRIRPFEVLSIYGDNSKLKKQTGWMPKHDIKESLKDILNWWRERS